MLRINVGGGDYIDHRGNIWSADTGFNTGYFGVETAAIAWTLDDPLFQTDRWDEPSGPEMAFSHPLANGSYRVNLYFAEAYDGITPESPRIFDVAIEGATVLSQFDIRAIVGPNAALIRSFDVTVSDGQLDIAFTHGVENPKICAIEVLAQN